MEFTGDAPEFVAQTAERVTAELLGPEAEGAVPELKQALGDKAARVRTAARNALERLGVPLPPAEELPPDALPPAEEAE